MKSISENVNEKIKSGKALSRRELATISGYSYDEILEFSKEGDFPIFRKKIYYSEFRRWRRCKMEVELDLHIPTGHQHLGEYKYGAPVQTHDSLASLPPRAAHLLARAG